MKTIRLYKSQKVSYGLEETRFFARNVEICVSENKLSLATASLRNANNKRVYGKHVLETLDLSK